MSNATNEIDPNAVINPSTGIYARNPTRVSITAQQDSQQEIVSAVKGAKQRTDTVIYDYANIDKADPPPLSGVLSIRDMDQKRLEGFFKSLMRSKPNIIKLHLKLGEYTNKRRVTNQRAGMLNSSKQRFHTEVAKLMADLFSDHTENIIEVLYTVNNADPAYFSATAEVYSVSKDDYENDEIFAPAIGVEYIVSH